MNRLLIFFIPMPAMLNTSCEWDPTGIYESDASPNTIPPNIEVRDFSFDMSRDSIELFSDVIYYDFQSEDHSIHWVEFFINDQSLGINYSAKGLFKLHRMDGDGNLFEGFHTLRIQLATFSGSGSIADQMGAEAFIFSFPQWVIKVRNNSSNNMTCGINGGFLTLRWINEDNYKFFIYRDGKEIGTTSGNSFTDQSYVGEGTHYTLKKNHLTYSLSDHGNIYMQKSIPELTFSIEDANKYVLR